MQEQLPPLGLGKGPQTEHTTAGVDAGQEGQVERLELVQAGEEAGPVVVVVNQEARQGHRVVNEAKELAGVANCDQGDLRWRLCSSLSLASSQSSSSTCSL